MAKRVHCCFCSR